MRHQALVVLLGALVLSAFAAPITVTSSTSKPQDFRNQYKTVQDKKLSEVTKEQLANFRIANHHWEHGEYTPEQRQSADAKVKALKVYKNGLDEAWTALEPQKGTNPDWPKSWDDVENSYNNYRRVLLGPATAAQQEADEAGASAVFANLRDKTEWRGNVPTAMVQEAIATLRKPRPEKAKVLAENAKVKDKLKSLEEAFGILSELKPKPT